MRGGADARREMETEAEVALLLHSGLAGVEAHPHAELLAVGPCVAGERALGGSGGGNRVARPPEDDEEGVALRAHLLAAVFREGRPHQRPVVGQDLRVAVAKPPEQPRRSLDVAEEEGECPARKLTPGHLRILAFAG